MAIEMWLAFVSASAVLLIMPGPTVLTVVSYSVAHGRRVKVPLIVAVALGDATGLLMSLLGLGVLLATSAFWFTVIKWLGGLYLMFLGIRLLRTGVLPRRLAAPDDVASRWRLFVNTYLVTALNPKSIVFFVAFLPQFVVPDAAPAKQLWILAVTYVIMSVIDAAAYSVFASSAHRFLHSTGAQRSINIAGGTLLTSAGVWALLAKRPA